MRKKVLFGIVGVFVCLILIILFISSYEKKSYTLEEAHQELLEIDRDFPGANFRQEQLNVTMAPYEIIDPLIERLEEFRQDVIDAPENNETILVIKLIEARIDMLKSEKYWMFAMRSGPKGKVNHGFNCQNLFFILNATYNFDFAAAYGKSATKNLDHILRNREWTWNILGVDENKIKFFNSEIGYAVVRSNENNVAIDMCIEAIKSKRENKTIPSFNLTESEK